LEQGCGWELPYFISVKKKELSIKQISRVPCPTCGSSAGEGCVLHSGGPRSAASNMKTVTKKNPRTLYRVEATYVLTAVKS